MAISLNMTLSQRDNNEYRNTCMHKYREYNKYYNEYYNTDLSHSCSAVLPTGSNGSRMCGRK